MELTRVTVAQPKLARIATIREYLVANVNLILLVPGIEEDQMPAFRIAPDMRQFLGKLHPRYLWFLLAGRSLSDEFAANSSLGKIG